jgi:2-polyprenyl-3-methyl-5-hydroxy-6-metoxy-1,4-benzoquinol methylase
MGLPPKSSAPQTPTACRICKGRLEFVQRGSSSKYEPSDFSPSCHRVGEHGDLYRCGDCGTVHQPSLPRGRELHDLYRAMSDERYLGEEAGRRRTARGLLDLLARHVPRGRLLQVGCGHGLLLDEARRRGYEVAGVELSVEAVRHARERLGLPVRDTALEDAALEDAALEGERYDAVLMVDVLEHLDDPVVALERLSALLRPEGALLVVTPDPASLVARVAGGRWWCYLPSHVCLIPRGTLHELIRGRGLVVVEDVPSVHSFTLAYWLAGLGERGGWLGSAVAYVAARLPRTVMLTASLRDERVLLARRLGSRASQRTVGPVG